MYVWAALCTHTGNTKITATTEHGLNQQRWWFVGEFSKIRLVTACVLHRWKPIWNCRSWFLIFWGGCFGLGLCFGPNLDKILDKTWKYFFSLCIGLSMPLPPSQRWWLRTDEGSCKWGHSPCRNSVVYVITSGYDPSGNVVAVGKSFVKTTHIRKLDHK